jgi:hypothetical protein
MNHIFLQEGGNAYELTTNHNHHIQQLNPRLTPPLSLSPPFPASRRRPHSAPGAAPPAPKALLSRLLHPHEAAVHHGCPRGLRAAVAPRGLASLHTAAKEEEG